MQLPRGVKKKKNLYPYRNLLLSVWGNFLIIASYWNPLKDPSVGEYNGKIVLHSCNRKLGHPKRKGAIKLGNDTINATVLGLPKQSA